MSTICIIPARGGSKRIPRKNIRDFCGKPMIAWSIETALESGVFDRIVVSTEDAEIAAIAKQCGAEVPFLRPAALAADQTATMPVIRHAIETLEKETPDAKAITLACCLCATAPFVEAGDLRRGKELLMDKGRDFAISVTTFSYPIQRALRLAGPSEKPRLEMIDSAQLETRSQELEPALHDASQFYWGRKTAFLNYTQMLHGDTAPVILPRFRVQDIDDEADWVCAERMFRALRINP